MTVAIALSDLAVPVVDPQLGVLVATYIPRVVDSFPFGFKVAGCAVRLAVRPSHRRDAALHGGFSVLCSSVFSCTSALFMRLLRTK